MIRVAIVGFGNVGSLTLEGLLASGDFNVVAIVDPLLKGKEIKEGIPVLSDIRELENVQVAIICAPSRLVPQIAENLVSQGVSTVDAYDLHSSIWDYQEKIGDLAKEKKAASIIAAGWDPGTDSIIRALLEVMSPKGLTYTDFGPGMSMGHTVAVKDIEGVKNALSMTMPAGAGVHRRMVYVELEGGRDFEEISERIKRDPYFANDETHVIEVENVDLLIDRGHGVHISRKGVSCGAHNQKIDFSMEIDNPALTAQILVSSARAVIKQKPGAYTMIEVPLIDFLPGDREGIIKSLV